MKIQLDLDLAWKRVKDDIKKGRVFVETPYEIVLVEQDLPSWIKNIQEKLESDDYSPSPSVVCDSPKENFGIRPGCHLNLTDRVVYAALLGECLPFIYKELSWSQNKVDFCHILTTTPQSSGLVENPFDSWINFRQQSIKKIEEGNTFVVMTDIAAFYENINIEILISDLRDMGIDVAVAELLKKCLRKWGSMNMKGLPQGYIASDILSKVYLNTIDANMKNKGHQVLRYSDDMRIFCKDKTEAKKSIMELIKLLRNRGLNIQSAKTKILSANDAKTEIDEVAAIINKTIKGIAKELSISGFGNPYMTIFNVREVLAFKSNISVKTVKKVYEKYFIEDGKKFNKTLLRFLLNLLGENNDRFAISNCSKLLIEHPEETKIILKYYSVTLSEQEKDKILGDFFKSTHAIYPYQNYLIFQFFTKQNDKPSSKIIHIAREFAFDRNSPFYLRSIARVIISNFGTSADLERIQSTYSETENELERAEIICSLARMEQSRRNSFLSQVKDEGDMQRRAVRYTKQIQQKSPDKLSRRRN